MDQPAALCAQGAGALHAPRSWSDKSGLVAVGNLLDDAVGTSRSVLGWNGGRRVAGRRHGGSVSRAISQHAIANAPGSSGERMACLDT
jgi:hypothetical protein